MSVAATTPGIARRESHSQKGRHFVLAEFLRSLKKRPVDTLRATEESAGSRKGQRHGDRDQPRLRVDRGEGQRFLDELEPCTWCSARR